MIAVTLNLFQFITDSQDLTTDDNKRQCRSNVSVRNYQVYCTDEQFQVFFICFIVLNPQHLH